MHKFQQCFLSFIDSFIVNKKSHLLRWGDFLIFSTLPVIYLFTTERSDFMTTIERILELLKQKGIEQQRFASDIGVTKQKISEWKSGKTKSYMKYLDIIAEYFNVSTDYLLGNETPDKQLEGIDFALMSESEELTVEQKNSVLNYIRFLKSGDNNKG